MGKIKNSDLYKCEYCERYNSDYCKTCSRAIDPVTGVLTKPTNFLLLLTEEESVKEDKKQYEYVDHPSHYGGEDNPYECIKVIEAWGLDKNFDLGTAIRYICRAGEKPDNPVLQDLKKARWYLDREIQKLEEKKND